jgi:hypothetical protein
MQKHFGLTDEEYKKLTGNGITIADLYNNVQFFDKNGSGEPISKIGLYYYIDQKGNFNSPPINLKHKQIARAVYNSLNLPAGEKLQILEYLDFAENNFVEDEEE